MGPGWGSQRDLAMEAADECHSSLERDGECAYDAIGHFTCAEAQVIDTLVERAGKV